jgi:hypothetical protein
LSFLLQQALEVALNMLWSVDILLYPKLFVPRKKAKAALVIQYLTS